MVPNAPPRRDDTSPAGIKIAISLIDNGTWRIKPKIKMPITWTTETIVSPRIFPKMIEYLEIGETKISWEKSFSRSWIREIIPDAVDWKNVWAKTPIKTNVWKL